MPLHKKLKAIAVPFKDISNSFYCVDLSNEFLKLTSENRQPNPVFGNLKKTNVTSKTLRKANYRENRPPDVLLKLSI